MKKIVSVLLASVLFVTASVSAAAFSLDSSVQWVETINGVETTVFGTVDTSSLSVEAKDILRRFRAGEFEDYILTMNYNNNLNCITGFQLSIVPENNSTITCAVNSGNKNRRDIKSSSKFWHFYFYNTEDDRSLFNYGVSAMLRIVSVSISLGSSASNYFVCSPHFEQYLDSFCQNLKVEMSTEAFTLRDTEGIISTPPIEEPEYILTVNYLFPDGSPASSPIQLPYKAGESYGVASPVITNYMPDLPSVSGEMPGHDLTVTVTYSLIVPDVSSETASSDVSSETASPDVSIPTVSNIEIPVTSSPVQEVPIPDVDHPELVMFTDESIETSIKLSTNNLSAIATYGFGIFLLITGLVSIFAIIRRVA